MKKQSFQKILQLPFEQIKLISKFEIKYQKKKKKVQGLISTCLFNINKFPFMYFSALYEIYSQWEGYIQIHAPHLLLNINYEYSKEDERLFPFLPDIN